MCIYTLKRPKFFNGVRDSTERGKRHYILPVCNITGLNLFSFCGILYAGDV